LRVKTPLGNKISKNNHVQFNTSWNADHRKRQYVAAKPTKVIWLTITWPRDMVVNPVSRHSDRSVVVVVAEIVVVIVVVEVVAAVAVAVVVVCYLYSSVSARSLMSSAINR